MNTFTWLIYVSGLMNKLGPLLFLAIMLFVFSLFGYVVISENRNRDKLASILWGWQRKFLIVWFLLVGVFIVVPDKETALIMAGSEVVSRGIDTEVGSELQKTIVHQLRELRKVDTK